MSRKESLKHAFKKLFTALCVIVIPAFLLLSRASLMNVQAASEEPVQTEDMAEGTEPEIIPEEAVQMPEEGAMEETQAQTEGEAEDAQTEGEAEEAQTEDAAKELQMQTEETENAATPLSVTMVGDSVMLGASPAILAVMPDCVIDAKVSRQVIQADSVLDSLEQQNLLRQTVVIALGTNGPFGVEKGQELIDRLGSGRTIYWVTAYGTNLVWQEESNATIRQLAEMNENVYIIDWAQAVSGHTEWLCSDGIHLSAEGRGGYAGIILGGLSQ